MNLRGSRDRPGGADGKARPRTWAFFKAFPRLLPYLRPRKGLVATSFALTGAGALMELLQPWPLAILIDTVLGNKPLPALLGVLDGLDRYTLLAIAVVSGLLVTAL